MSFPVVRLFLPSAIATTLVLASPALAQTAAPASTQGQVSPAEQLVRGWLKGFVSPTLAVEPGTFSYDKATDTLTVTGTSFVRDIPAGVTPGAPATPSPPGAAPGAAPGSTPGATPKSTIRIATSTFTGLANGPRALTVASVGLRGITILADGVDGSLSVAGVDIDGAVLSTGSLAIDPAKPFSSHTAVLRELARSGIRSVRVNGVEISQKKAEASADLTLAGIELTNIAAGKISALAVSGLATRTLAGTTETSRFEMAGLTLKDLDLEPYIKMVEPSAYLSQTGERPWQTFAQLLSISKLKSVAGTETATIEQVDVGPLKLRQFPQDLSAILDKTALDPDYLKNNRAEAGLVTASLLDAFTLDQGSVTRFDFTSTGNREGSIGSFSLTGLNARGIASLGLRDFAFKDPNGRLTASRIGLGRITLPSPATLVAAQAAQTAGTPIDPLALVPTLGLVELEQVAVTTPAVSATLGALKLDLNYYIKAVPTNVRASIANLNIPLAAVTDPRLKQVLADWGYPGLDLSAEVLGAWNDSANEVSFERLNLSLADMGSLTLSGSITNIPRSVFENPRLAQSQLIAAGLRKFRINYTDASLFGRVLATIAAQARQSPEQIRKTLATNMPAMLSAIPDTTLRTRMAFAAIAFLNETKSLEIFSTTNDPIPFAAIAGAAAAAPQTLPVLLKLDVVANRK